MTQLLDTGVLIHLIAVIVITLVAMLAAFKGYHEVLWQKKQAERVELEIKRAENETKEKPEKSKPAWDLARATLEAYFNRNLSQISLIFWLSVVVMLIGFVIVGIGIFLVYRNPSAYTPAIIAGVAGIITQFIGATFLFIYRSTIRQAINYTHTLERINSVGMAMQILDTMPDITKSDDLKSKTKAVLVELLVREAHLSCVKNASDADQKS